MDVALSGRGAWLLRAFFAAVVVLLYAPIVVCSSSRSTTRRADVSAQWVHAALVPPVPPTPTFRMPSRRAPSSLRSRASAQSSSACWPRSRSSATLPGDGTVSGAAAQSARDPVHRLRDLAAAALPRRRGRSGRQDRRRRAHRDHDPYAILVMMPGSTDRRLARTGSLRPGRRLRTFRSITLPLMLPAVVSAYLIAFTTSFDEYAVASFVKAPR